MPRIKKKKPQEADIEFKCEECGFVGNTNISVKKHVKTNHAPLLMVDNDKEKEIVEECIEDLYQIDVMEGENEYACNVCNGGFYRDDEIKNHITSNHKEVLHKMETMKSLKM